MAILAACLYVFEGTPDAKAYALGGFAVLLSVAGAVVGLHLWSSNRKLLRTLDRQTKELLEANAALRDEVDERRQMELALMRYKAHLEIQVKAGTCELQKAVADHRQARETLNEYQVALEASDDMVTVLDRRYIFRMVNDAYLKQRKCRREAIIGTSIVEAIGPEAFHAIKPHLDACFQGEVVEYEMSLDDEAMGKRHLWVRYYPARSSSGRVHRVVSVIKDITVVKRAEQDRERVFRLSVDPICVADFNGYFKDVNPAWTRLLGWSKEELLSIPWCSFLHPEDTAASEAVVHRLEHGQTVKDFRNRYVAKDGRVRWLEWNAIPDVEEGLVYAMARDVTDQIKTQRILKKFSLEDSLTGIANRRRFDAALAQEWQRGLRERQHLALIMMDIDHFKAYNDIYGHQAGDESLRKVAACLRKNVHRAGDLVARYGGEEFVAILPNTDPAGAREVAEAMQRTVRKLGLRHEGAPGRGRLSISAGVVSAVPRRGENPAWLLEKADQALYQAKRAGRDCVMQAALPYPYPRPERAVAAVLH